MKSNEIYAIIPARGGSKGVPKKNIKLLKGHPIIAYSIAVAKLSRKIDRIIVSTDSPEIAEISRKYGAEVPFLRPEEFAQDKSPDIDFIKHALDWFEHNEKSQPDLIVHLRPTTPLREPVLIDKAIENILKDINATSLRSVHELAEPPQKMLGIEDGYLTGLFPNDIRPEYYNLPRQEFPKAYHPNGYVDIIKPEYVNRYNQLFGPKMLGFVTPFTVEIDNPEDYDYLEYIIDKESHPLYHHLIHNL